MNDAVARDRRWEIGGAVLAAVLVLVAVGVALVVALPPTLANLSGSRADGATPLTLERDGRSAEIVVPEDWIVTRQAPDVLVVRTPDAALQATVELVEAAPDAALEPPADAGAVRTETLASGAVAVHADLPEGLVAAVAAEPATSVRIVVEVPPPARTADYRAAIAQLLDGVRA